MQSDCLLRLKEWFDTYTGGFLSGDPNQDKPLTMKIDHTARVAENINQLASRIGLAENAIHLAAAIALFHDLGRFEQYRRYRTFNDRRSVNHATQGVEVLGRAGILEPLPDNEKDIMIDAIRFHNAPALPEGNTSEAMVFMRLIRDADKLDIWKVFADCYRNDMPPHPTIFQHLPDHPTWEPKIVQAILQRRTARFSDMGSITDFKLLQLSWIFGLHFPVTAVLARERGDIAAIARTLPADDPIQRAVGTVMAQLQASVG